MEHRTYSDLHAHITALEQNGLLFRVKRPINKDTEMHPLVRWQFRGGIAESERKGFLFENVVDSTGRRYDIPVAVGILASNREIYSLGIGCKVEDIKKQPLIANHIEAGSLDAGYAGRLVPGALVFSYAEGLVMQTGVIHGTGMAFLRADLSVQAPVFVGDTITVVVEVVAARAASTGARGVVTTRNTVVKRGGGTVLVYEPVRLIRGRPAPGPATQPGQE